MKPRSFPGIVFWPFSVCLARLGASAGGNGQNPPTPTPSGSPSITTKYEHRIPMRDGVRLFTRVYVAPRDDAKAWPILLTRTPYAFEALRRGQLHTDPSGSFRTFATNKFILVHAGRARDATDRKANTFHVRPFNPNKGTKDADESSDAWDTIGLGW